MNDDFVNSVIDILDSVRDGSNESLIATAEKIHSLADYARQTPLYKNSIEKGTETFEGKTPIEIYNHMIIKIVESPTTFHRDAAVILTIPYLSDALKNI